MKAHTTTHDSLLIATVGLVLSDRRYEEEVRKHF
jgi:hypothetical protein